jgi:hypothetical protein
MTRGQYKAFLMDPRWQKRRLEVFARDKWACTVCDDKDTTLEVNHRRYPDNGGPPWESELGDLETLCSPCHRQVTRAKADAHRRLAALRGSDLLWLAAKLRAHSFVERAKWEMFEDDGSKVEPRDEVDEGCVVLRVDDVSLYEIICTHQTIQALFPSLRAEGLREETALWRSKAWIALLVQRLLSERMLRLVRSFGVGEEAVRAATRLEKALRGGAPTGSRTGKLLLLPRSESEQGS